MTIPPRQLLPIALIAAATSAAWLAAPSPPRPQPAPSAQEAWAMPALQTGDPAQWIATINQRKLWGGAAAAEQEAAGRPEAEKDWSLVGVVIKGGDRFVLVSVGDDASKPYRIGDTLPNGAKILDIEEDRLRISTNAIHSVLEIYRK